MGLKLKCAFLALAIFANAVYIASAANIHADGGYDVVIAIDKDVVKTISPSPRQYLENIKISLQRLSTSMYIATNKFWIKSVRILVPTSWDLGEEDTQSTVYQNADIRITNDTDVPLVQNPNLCRLPGEYMELPNSFFDVANYNDYGEIHKALLHQWARLRWGVWEEHGYPGDTRFPYFYNNSGTWTVTGCSDVPIQGEWKHVTNPMVTCDPTAAQLDEGCRLYPFYNNTAKSSIMSFHNTWSVEKFCDAASKDMNAPHRQSLLCDGQSSMETIETSADFAKVTNGIEPKPLSIHVVKPMKNVPLHIVVDRGMINTTDVAAVVKLFDKLREFFDVAAETSFLSGQHVALSVFGETANGGKLREVFPVGVWNDTLREHVVDMFINYNLGEAENRDFSLAVQDAANAVADVNPAVGAFVLLIKTGRTNNPATITSLKETERALLAKRTQLYTIELGELQLTTVVAATQGASALVEIESEDHNLGEVDDLMKVITDALNEPAPVGNDGTRESVSGESIAPGVLKNIYLPSGADSVRFYFTHEARINPSDIKGGIVSNQFMYYADFNESRELGSAGKFVYEATLDISKMDVTEISFTYALASSMAEGVLYVTSEGTEIEQPIVLSVATSNDGSGVVDLDNPANPYQPFAIFVRLTQGQSPVTGASVTCTFRVGDNDPETLTLADTGDGQADVAANDGVYSIVFVPKHNGNVATTCHAAKSTAIPPKPSNPVGRSIPRLLPVDQNFKPSLPVEHPAGLVVSGELLNQITIVNRDKYEYTLTSIKDLKVHVNPQDTHNLTFTFSRPQVLGDGRFADGYRVFLTDKKENLATIDLSAGEPQGVTEATVTSQATDVELKASYISAFTQGADVYVMVVAFADTPNEAVTRIYTNSNVETFAHQGENPGNDDDSDEGKPFFKTTGGIVTIVGIVVVILGVAAGGFFYMKRKRSASTGSRA